MYPRQSYYHSKRQDGRGPRSQKGDDALEGTSRLKLSADDRDAIVESLVQRLTSLKEKSDPPHTEDSSKFTGILKPLPACVACQHAFQSHQIMSPPTLSLTGETALGKPPGGKAPPTLPTIKSTEATGHPPSLSEAWVNILETHLNKQKCDPTAEEDSDWETTSERFQLFPELGLIQPGHKLKYTFLQLFHNLYGSYGI